MAGSDSGYTVFTEAPDDHSKVFIISEFSSYGEARRCAKAHSAIVMFTDQFQTRFTPTTPNGMNGIRA